MSDIRLDLLEKKMEVMQSEISQVLGEMQTTIQAMAKMFQVGMKVIDSRLTSLEGPQEKADEKPQG
jgi:hypothetical protein